MLNYIWHKPEPSPIDPLIAECLGQMEHIDEATDEYTKMAQNLKTLVEAKAAEPKPKKLDVNTVAVIAANLAGIAMILIAEKSGSIVTSKGMNFVMKPHS
jgi:hypothetical protein